MGMDAGPCWPCGIGLRYKRQVWEFGRRTHTRMRQGSEGYQLPRLSQDPYSARWPSGWIRRATGTLAVDI